MSTERRIAALFKTTGDGALLIFDKTLEWGPRVDLEKERKVNGSFYDGPSVDRRRKIRNYLCFSHFADGVYNSM